MTEKVTQTPYMQGIPTCWLKTIYSIKIPFNIFPCKKYCLN